jgi:hypothetical protein
LACLGASCLTGAFFSTVFYYLAGDYGFLDGVLFLRAGVFGCECLVSTLEGWGFLGASLTGVFFLGASCFLSYFLGGVLCLFFDSDLSTFISTSL